MNIASFAVGTGLGWTSPVNPKLNNVTLVDSPLPAVPTDDEGAWIGSLVALTAIVGECAAERCVASFFDDDHAHNILDGFGSQAR